MAVETRKRKPISSLRETTKRLRTDEQLPTQVDPIDQSDDDSNDNYDDGEASSSDSGSNHRTDTPVTPLSPALTGKAKFPSQLKTIVCTYEGCTKTFNRPARLATHLLKHEGKKTFICAYEGCDKAYFEQKHLTSHIKGSHAQERPYKCNWNGCGKSFLTATRLKRHNEAHQGHDRFRCTAYPPCNQTFRKHQTLHRHIRSEHLNESPFPCTFVDPITNVACDSGFDAASKLKRHKDQVHGDLKFFCDECTIPGKINPDGSPMKIGFSTKVKLQAHVKSSHANCQFCERKFFSQRELQKHIETQHSGTSLEERKNIACTYQGCGRKFTKKSNLNSHIKTAHQGERYICGAYDLSKTRDLSSWDNEDGCDQPFVSKANLEDHVRTAHLGLPSLINKNRKKAMSEDNEFEDVDNFYQQPKKQRGGKKPKPSPMDELLGLTYDERRTIPCIVPDCAHMFIRNYDLQVHIRSKHRLSTPEIEGMASEMFEDPSSEGSLYQEEEDFDNMEAMDALYEGIDMDMDWEMQRRALEGGPFWVGADEQAVVGMLDTGEWVQDEPEMRRLIDQDAAFATIDPSLR